MSRSLRRRSVVGLLLFLSPLVQGCASHAPRSTPNEPVADTARPQYESASASALAFDSPVCPPYALAGLARGPREPAAFAGYEDTVAEYFAITVDDHQSSDYWNNSYDRESVSVKVGVRYR